MYTKIVLLHIAYDDKFTCNFIYIKILLFSKFRFGF